MTSISIITATWNAANTLSDCLDSVVNQDVKVEHILVDGASTDKTLEVANEYGEYLAKVVSEPDSGIYHAMNKGIKLASGDVIGILNSDDFYPDDRVVRRVVEVFENDEIDACYGDLRYVDFSDTSRIVRYWRSGEFDPAKFYNGWMPPHPTFFVRRAVYERYGLFNLQLGSAADYEIMLRFLLRYRVRAVYIPHVLVHMRTGGVSNSSLVNRLRANCMDRKAWEVNGLKPRPWTLVMKPLRKVGQWVLK